MIILPFFRGSHMYQVFHIGEPEYKYMNHSTFEAGIKLIGFASCTIYPYLFETIYDLHHPFQVQRCFNLFFRVVAPEERK